MNMSVKKRALLIGSGVAVGAFVLLLIGIRAVLGNEVTVQNGAAFGGFALVSGLIAASLVFFRLRIAALFYGLGLVIGFFEMYRAFVEGMSGWGDLIGLISLFLWIAIGLGVGLVGQSGYYLYHKFVKSGK